MQGLIYGQRSVRGHPKARSKLDTMEHHNFLFGMEIIRPQVAKACNKFSTLLDLEGCSGDVPIRVVRNKWCIAEIVLVGDRGPGSRQWCINPSEPNNIAFSTPKRMGEVEYLSSLTYPVEELCISSMASAALLKSSFLPRRSEWHTIRKSSTPQSTVVAFSVRAGAYSDELVKTAVCTS
ncbi:hypothetical protein B296_00046325 [Ensete ventricosum]|uniref:Uncharacterized protein n=1 Tax=Ensete ventricosum TaxID=4639 RepID=A0A426YUV7_ENSVE|nr:hypothetical protein B296_00046325 [Ensete ventricosum]